MCEHKIMGAHYPEKHFMPTHLSLFKAVKSFFVNPYLLLGVKLTSEEALSLNHFFFFFLFLYVRSIMSKSHMVTHLRFIILYLHKYIVKPVLSDHPFR